MGDGCRCEELMKKQTGSKVGLPVAKHPAEDMDDTMTSQLSVNMKRFYGSLVVVLGIVASMALLVSFFGTTTPATRLPQVLFSLVLLAIGYFLTRNPRPTT